MSTMFSPLHAPPRKTMGLLQRSFVDVATRTESPLQIAMVVDGTESMSQELAAVRDSIDRMIKDLGRSRSRVEVAIVVYRDSLCDAGETEILLRDFSSDDRVIIQAVAKLLPMSGEPFFHELADVGIHTALTQLPWSEDPATHRWILWFGDAPPYETTFQSDAFPKSRRRFSDELLITVANRKQIQINTVVCTSSQNVSDPYGKTIDATRDFVSRLAEGTDGLILDLSYPEVRTALVDASRRPAAQYTRIAPINRQDLIDSADALGDVEAKADGPVQVAVLPMQPIDQMRFDPNLDSVKIATAIRHRLSQTPGFRMASTVDVKKQLRRIRAEGVPIEQRIRVLTTRLGVDYVIWGEAVAPNQIRTAAYRRRDGKPLFTMVSGDAPDDVTSVILRAAAMDPTVGGDVDADGLESLTKRLQAAQKATAIPGRLAESQAATNEILVALESLHQALGMSAGETESNRLMQTAQTAIQSAIKTEPQNPLVHWLQANIAMNQATAFYAKGEQESADDRMRIVRSSLRRAARGKQRLHASLADEITADELLLVQRDPGGAIDAYESLTKSNHPDATRRRAHWMLSGLYAGDWGAGAGLVDSDKLRQHVMALMRDWPDSSEATRLKKWFQWDAELQTTRYQHFPKVHTGLAELGL
ncbi:MAG: vWA domain-containing protein [Planctomycetota bacterium]